MVLGPRPTTASGLTGFPGSDAEVKRVADELWGKGSVLTGKTAREVLLSKGLKPDFEWKSKDATEPDIDYIHRTLDGAEIYFLANRSTNAATVDCTFRGADKAPELWDAVTGDHRFATSYSQVEGHTTVPLEFAPCGSRFIVFREPAAQHPANSKRNDARFEAFKELEGSWAVSFDPKWGGPESAQFDSLVSWPTRPEPGIKFYSGKAVYRKSFDLPAGANGQSLWLDLGEVRELAEVKLNGQSCGIAWASPFRLDISRAAKPGTNQLEIEVVNFWPNRIIGDESLPEAQRLTKTNIRKLTSKTPLVPSGLLGPVRLEAAVGP
jgi:hypothetical protein